MRRWILGGLLAVGVVVVIELLSLAVWHFAVPDSGKSKVLGLAGRALPHKVPNSFWHHGLNSEHPLYRGIVNSQGTKGDDFPTAKPPGELRIVCLGNSTVEGIEQPPEQTFPGILERRLQTAIDEIPNFTSVHVINAGIGSHNSAFNLAYFAFRLIHFDPDILILKSSYNDFLPYCIPGMTVDYTHAFPKPFHAHKPGVLWRLVGSSHLLKNVSALLLASRLVDPFEDFSGYLTDEQFLEMDYSENESQFFVYGENIRSIILLCRGRGIVPVVLDLPTSPEDDHYGTERGVGFRDLIRRLENELERITQEESVRYVVTGPLAAEDFWDHCHNTPGGNDKIAAQVESAVLDVVGRNRN